MEHVIEYISILYGSTKNKSIKFYNECIDATAVNLDEAIDTIKSILDNYPLFKPVYAKIKRSDIYHTLMICHNITEAKHRPFVRKLSNRANTIYIDKIKGKEVDINAYFPSKQVDNILADRKFVNIITGECPNYILFKGYILTGKYEGIEEKFVQAIHKYLIKGGLWIIYNYAQRVYGEGKISLENTIIKDISAFGFRLFEGNYKHLENKRSVLIFTKI